ncbi:MAG TPA: metallophosphoesterase [Firmicutes bacterium]|jgi:predicted phosphodiesterase|nr:metallophosphoesterase [Bacillota bacterium]
MKRKEQKLNEALSRLLEEAPHFSITNNDKIVVFSDLHMGNGGRHDDFLPNSEFFKYILEQYYLKNHYKLILNGDIEELQKFSLKQIKVKWRELYHLFDEFDKKGAFFKLVGNHDSKLFSKKTDTKKPLYHSLKLNYNQHQIVIFHGHQASLVMKHFNSFCSLALRYIISPIGIKNYSISHNSTTKFNTEKRVYDFARTHKVVSLIGHTHRPLFESLSKIEYLKFKIEQYCRDYSQGDKDQATLDKLAAKIKKFNAELQYLSMKKNIRKGSRSSLYNSDLMVPCMFNSGCAIGKTGITAIEIADGKISLIHWFDRRKSQKYLDYNGYTPVQMENTEYFRVALKEDNLNYIFARIELLA